MIEDWIPDIQARMDPKKFLDKITEEIIDNDICYSYPYAICHIMLQTVKGGKVHSNYYNELDKKSRGIFNEWIFKNFHIRIVSQIDLTTINEKDMIGYKQAIVIEEESAILYCKIEI